MSGLARCSCMALTWNKPCHCTICHLWLTACIVTWPHSIHRLSRSKLLYMLQIHSAQVTFAPILFHTSCTFSTDTECVHLVQANKQANTHTHMCNAVTLVWGLLKPNPTRMRYYNNFYKSCGDQRVLGQPKQSKQYYFNTRQVSTHSTYFES